MIFDELGLPRDNGATDFNDSSRLAGVMTVFGYSKRVDCSMYVLTTHRGLFYRRHPTGYSYDFSRDQTVPLVAGLYKQGFEHLVSLDYVDGRDFFSPSHRGHIRICQGKKPFWHQRIWIWVDVLWSCYVKPMSEPNQLLCMMMVNPDKSYLKCWVRNNKKWEDSIKGYWSGWRGEQDLALVMIEKIRAEVGEI